MQSQVKVCWEDTKEKAIFFFNFQQLVGLFINCNWYIISYFSKIKIMNCLKKTTSKQSTFWCIHVDTSLFDLHYAVFYSCTIVSRILIHVAIYNGRSKLFWQWLSCKTVKYAYTYVLQTGDSWQQSLSLVVVIGHLQRPVVFFFLLIYFYFSLIPFYPFCIHYS